MKKSSLNPAHLIALFSLVATLAMAQAPAPSAGSPSIPEGQNHGADFDAELLHFTDQGSGFFPMSVVSALKDSKTGRLYLENLERFGLVPGKVSNRNPNGFPVGITPNTVKVGGRQIEMFGFTCAACHTSDLRFNGQTVRIEGGSGAFYVDQLGDQIADSLKATLEDPEEFFAFLIRFAKNSRGQFHPTDNLQKLGPVEAQPPLLHQVLLRHLKEKGQELLAEIKKQPAPAPAPVPAPPQNLSEEIAERLRSDVENALGGVFGDLGAIIEDLRYRIDFLKYRNWLSSDPTHRLAAGYGRADDFGTARVELYGDLNPKNMASVNAPVSTPPLWNIDRYAWLHWNANTNSVIQRSIGEAIGVGAGLTHGDTTTVNIVNQMKIEEQVHQLTAPLWPDAFGKPDDAMVARGREIYKTARCAECHDPQKLDAKGLVVFRLSTIEEVGTDPADAINFDQSVWHKDGSKASFAESIGSLLTTLQGTAKAAMSKTDQDLMDVLEKKQTPVLWRDTRTATGGPVYPAKPLEGVWATAPYLHNGSVPTLYALLRPNLRPPTFMVGQKDFDPKDVGLEIDEKKITPQPGLELFKYDTTIPGNLNTGHRWGQELSEEDCRALIEYLKVHRDTWPVKQAAYLEQHAGDYAWFAGASDSYAGIPLILLRSLPDLAPEIWGAPEEQFARFGYLPNPDAPLPLGLSWTSMDPAHPPQPLHPVALTCGACHIGSVRREDGSISQLVGAPNTKFDVRLWRKAFELTVHQLMGTPDQIKKTADRLSQIIASKPPNYYYRSTGGVSDAVEAGERQFISAKAPDILTSFANRILLSELATNAQKATSYSKSNAPPLDGGSPGQSDGSGDLIPRLLLIDSVTQSGPVETAKSFLTTPHPALPNQMATVTDILSTFQLGIRNVAQTDGSVKSPFFRNVAASLAVAGDPSLVNVMNADITARFISHLPAPPYPFAIDSLRAGRGQEIFRVNCSGCHKPYNDIVYPVALIGTDGNRSRVLNSDGLALFVRHFLASVPESLSLASIPTDYESWYGGKTNYRPRDLPVSSILFDRTKLENQGYVANTLDGAWTRAPYLHSGSVPTLYHLLVPSERPAKFLRGSISYDSSKVGFQWDLAQIDTFRKADPTVAVYDTSWDSASKLGHDTNLTIDERGQILRAGWDGPSRAGEFRVRLDWSAPENREALTDLLEYLKTL